MTSMDVKWSLVEGFASVLFYPSLALLILGGLKLKITFDSGRTLRIRASWFYVLNMIAMMLYFLSNIATGDVKGAVFDGLGFVLAAVLYRRLKDHEDDDDKKDGKRVGKTLGEKSRAKVREMTSRLKPVPAPRPVPVRN